MAGPVEPDTDLDVIAYNVLHNAQPVNGWAAYTDHAFKPLRIRKLVLVLAA